MPRPILATALALFALQPAAVAFAAGPAPAPGSAPALSSDPAFSRVWERTDQLVQAHNVARTWFWGEAPFARLNEPFAGAQRAAPGRVLRQEPHGDHQPQRRPLSPWFVTNGLLVKELMTGLVALGRPRRSYARRRRAGGGRLGGE